MKEIFVIKGDYYLLALVDMAKPGASCQGYQFVYLFETLNAVPLVYYVLPLTVFGLLCHFCKDNVKSYCILLSIADIKFVISTELL